MPPRPPKSPTAKKKTTRKTKPEQLIKKTKRPFLDSKTNNKAQRIIDDFRAGRKILNDPFIAPDVEHLIVFRDNIQRLLKKEKAYYRYRDKEIVKNTEFQLRAVLKDIAAKRAKLRGDGTYVYPKDSKKK